MIEIKNNENAELCGKCGGKCCKTLAGSCFPEDFGNTADEIKKNVREAIKSEKYCLDCWEGDPRDNIPEDKQLSIAYFLRPRHKNAINKLFDASWGGECIFLKERCALPFEKRPKECKSLEPKNAERCSANGITKKEASIAWIPFWDFLDNLRS